MAECLATEIAFGVAILSGEGGMHFSSPKLKPVPWKVKSPAFLMASFRNCLEFEERDIVFSGIF